MFKKGILLLFVVLTSVQFVLAQQKKVYSISLGNFGATKVFDFPAFANQGLLYSQTLGNDLHKIKLGDYSDYSDALEVLNTVKKSGYSTASITAVDPNNQSTYFVQLSTIDYHKQLSMSLQQGPEQRFLVGLDNKIRILQGPYNSREEADKALQTVKAQKDKDAFIAKYPMEMAHPLNEFYFDQELLPSKSIKSYSSEVPNPFEDEETLFELNESGTFWDLHFSAKAKRLQKPGIRGNKKRTSSLELQKLLKKDGAYDSSLDGYYGKGTAKAYTAVYNKNKYIQFLQSILPESDNNKVVLELNSLNDCLTNIPFEPQMCYDKLQTISDPLAGAYLSYLEMIAKGPTEKINKTMNLAIRLTFENGSKNPGMRFDPNANYDYQNVEQVIHHLLYMHMNAGTENSAPCWLYDYHIKEISSFSAKDPVSFSKINWNNCQSMFGWEEMDLLLLLARQISVDDINDFEGANGWNQQMELFYNNELVSESNNKANKAWSDLIIKNVYKWGTKDEYLSKLSYSFRLLYFQNLVLLEDLFMDKGNSVQESQAMALAAMNSLLSPYMTNFLD